MPLSSGGSNLERELEREQDCVLDFGEAPRRASSDPCVPTSPCTPCTPLTPLANGPRSPRRRRLSSSCTNASVVSGSGVIPPAPPAPKPQIVQAEFVYADGGHTVALCGDWNSWKPQAMEKEADGNGIWSTVVLVPTGLREFCYLVDGHYQVSRRHPTNAQSTANWRTVHGPPSPTPTNPEHDGRLVKSTTPRILRFADNAALRLRAVLSGSVGRTTLPSNNADLVHRKPHWRANTLTGSFQALAVVFVILATLLTYFAFRASYS